MAYKLSLRARNQGVEYVDASGVYRFDVSLKKGVWTVHLPATFGDTYEIKVLTDGQREIMLPRIVEYLAKVRWLGLFARSYRVQVVEHETQSQNP